MSDRKIIPIWEKVGVIPHPKMSASRVDSGLLLSLIAREADKEHGSLQDALISVRNVVLRTIDAEILLVDLYDDPDDASQVLVDIRAQDRWPYRYFLYVPNSWFTRIKNKK